MVGLKNKIMKIEIDFKKARTAHLRLGAVSCWAFYSVDGLGFLALDYIGKIHQDIECISPKGTDIKKP